MSKKNLVGGIVLAGAAAAAAAAVVAAKKLRKPEPEEPIRLDLDDNQITDVVLEELDGDTEPDTMPPKPPRRTIRRSRKLKSNLWSPTAPRRIRNSPKHKKQEAVSHGRLLPFFIQIQKYGSLRYTRISSTRQFSTQQIRARTSKSSSDTFPRYQRSTTSNRHPIAFASVPRAIFRCSISWRSRSSTLP